MNIIKPLLKKHYWLSYLALSLLIGYFFYAFFTNSDLSAQETKGQAVIMATFLLLTCITIYAIKKNTEIYRLLDTNINQLSRTASSPVWEQVMDAYRDQHNNFASQQSIQTFIEAYFSNYKFDGKHTLANRIKFIQTLGSITILVGVLGTFVGLVFALEGIDEDALQGSIMDILAGVNTAFYTSIAGIVFSILINLYNKIKNSDQLFIQLMLEVENKIQLEEQQTSDRQVVMAMDEVKEAIQSMSQNFIDIKNFSEGFEKATDNMNRFNDEFSANTVRLNSLFQNMELITTVFNERADQIHTDFGRLFTYFDKQDQRYEEIHASMKQISSDTRELVTGQAEFQHGMMQETRQFQDSQNQFMSRTQESFDSISKEIAVFMDASVERIHNAYEQMSVFMENGISMQKTLVESQARIEGKNNEYIKHVSAATDTMKRVLENSSFQELSGIAESIGGFSERINGVTRRLARMADQDEETVKLLKAVTTDLKGQMGEQRNSQDLFFAQIQSHMEQNESLHEAYKQAVKHYQVNNAALMDLTRSMKTEFKENYSQITGQTSALLEAIQEFVRKTESNMDENLQKSIREFGIYIKRTNEIIDKKFDVFIGQSFLENEYKTETFQSLDQSISHLDKNIVNLANKLEQQELLQSS